MGMRRGAGSPKVLGNTSRGKWRGCKQEREGEAAERYLWRSPGCELPLQSLVSVELSGKGRRQTDWCSESGARVLCDVGSIWDQCWFAGDKEKVGGLVFLAVFSRFGFVAAYLGFYFP
jgi:hypothetical protein